ncbi:hypothetical protein LZ30DRAFT_722076 [Colletotrichum cereale]|nr:hypothetical protein LZ30DRAFT_722076 [Colletotrichum cereale]
MTRAEFRQHKGTLPRRFLLRSLRYIIIPLHGRERTQYKYHAQSLTQYLRYPTGRFETQTPCLVCDSPGATLPTCRRAPKDDVGGVLRHGTLMRPHCRLFDGCHRGKETLSTNQMSQRASGCCIVIRYQIKEIWCVSSCLNTCTSPWKVLYVVGQGEGEVGWEGTWTFPAKGPPWPTWLPLTR